MVMFLIVMILNQTVLPMMNIFAVNVVVIFGVKIGRRIVPVNVMVTL